MGKKTFHFISTPVFTVLGRIGGVIVPFFIAYYFGAGRTTDAFFFAFGLIVSLAGLFTPIFESLLIPYLSEFKEFPKKAASISNGVLLMMVPAAAAVLVLIAAGMRPVLSHFSGFEPESAALTVRLFLEMSPLLIFWVLASAENGIFYTRQSFWFPAVSPLIRSLCVIAVLYLMHAAWGIHAVTGGFAVGEMMRWAIGLILLIRLAGWRPVIQWRETRDKMKCFMKQAGYQVTALLALNLIPVTDQWFASWLGTGSLTLLSYADRLFQIPFQLAMTGFLQIFLSYWSESRVKDSPEEFWKKAKKDMRITSAVAIGLSILLVVFREPVIRLFYGWGGHGNMDIPLLSTLFGWLAAGFAPAVLNLLYVRILFVMKKTFVFCVQSVIRLVLNIILNYFFMQWWGLAGIAAATAVVFILTTLWLHGYLVKAWKGVPA